MPNCRVFIAGSTLVVAAAVAGCAARSTEDSPRSAAAVGAMPGAVPPDARAHLIGAWRLVSIVDSLPEGRVASWMGDQPEGLLVYSADGHVAAQIMNPAGRPRFSGHGAEASDAAVRAAYNTYYAYYGTFDVFPESSLVVHHVRGSLEPWEVGVDHRRLYQVEGDRLRIRSRPERGGVRYPRWLTWERAH